MQQLLDMMQRLRDPEDGCPWDREQDFSSIEKTKLSYAILGKKISSNEIITLTNTNAQVSYDLKKMKLEL